MPKYRRKAADGSFSVWKNVVLDHKTPVVGLAMFTFSAIWVIM